MFGRIVIAIQQKMLIIERNLYLSPGRLVLRTVRCIEIANTITLARVYLKNDSKNHQNFSSS